MTKTLWHWTCDHCVEPIREDGVIIPPSLNPRRVREPASAVMGAVVWATDLRIPMPHALGLANLSGIVKCDRTAHRFRITDTTNLHPWVRLSRDLRESFGPIQWSDGARPAHWWIADVAVPVEYDPVPARS